MKRTYLARATLALVLAVVCVGAFSPPDAGAVLTKAKVQGRWRNANWNPLATPPNSPDTLRANIQTSKPETLDVSLDNLIVPQFGGGASVVLDSLSHLLGVVVLVSDTLNGLATLDSINVKLIGINGVASLVGGAGGIAGSGFVVDSLKVFPTEGWGGTNGHQVATIPIYYGAGASGALTLASSKWPRSIAAAVGTQNLQHSGAAAQYRKLLYSDRIRFVFDTNAASARSVQGWFYYWYDKP